MIYRAGCPRGIVEAEWSVVLEVANGWAREEPHRRGRVPWVPRSQIEAHHDLEIVARVVAVGVVQQWAGVEGGPFLVLGAWAAAELGLKLEESRVGGPPRWHNLDTEPPPDHCPHQVVGEHHRASRESWPYPQAEPTESVPEESGDPPATRSNLARLRPPTLVDEWSGREVRLFTGPTGQGAGIPIHIARRFGRPRG